MAEQHMHVPYADIPGRNVIPRLYMMSILRRPLARAMLMAYLEI
jgi:hypothetical protein